MVEQSAVPIHKRTAPTGGLFVGLSTDPNIWGQRDNRFKSDEDMGNWEPEHPPPPEIAIDEEQVREELNLSDQLTVTELQAIRRSFARQNHPDARTDNAPAREERMKIANMIIDQQIERRARAQARQSKNQ